MPIDWKRFAQIVGSARRVLLVSHVRPDCDALGSELGMAGILQSLGKDVVIVNGQPTPPNLAFIDPTRRLKAIGVDIQPNELDDVDLILILDTTAWAQLGPMADVVRASKAKKIVVDHHVDNDEMGAELFKDSAAEATGRLVVEAAEALGVALTPEIAAPLFAALATDTGWFRFGSTTPLTFEVAGKLVAAGARPNRIFQELYERDTLARVLLRGRILARTALECDGRLVHTAVYQEDFAASGALPSDTEDVVNLTLAIDGTLVAVILVEQPDGRYKVSFRSRTAQVDCSALARSFGGGGHKAAAGAFVDGPRAAAAQRVLDAVRAALR